MSDDPVIFDGAGAILRLTLNRPQRLNACDRTMLGALSDALAEAGNSADARVLILTGAGRAFSAGQDLTDKSATEDGKAIRDMLERYYNPVIRQIRGLPLPVICAVNGPAAGAGIGLALACDFVLAKESAVFDLAFTRLGLIPDAGLSFMLPRHLGWAKALGLSLLGERLTAPEAVKAGLIWQCIADDAFDNETEALARRLAELPTKSLGLVKQAFQAGQHHSLERQLALEAELQAAAAETEDFREGLAAFLQKRKPRFAGR
jgi:2-(1,2-epoxy-1,2-dihydrophenyl)acetyl-CoA isomerase